MSSSPPKESHGTHNSRAPTLSLVTDESITKFQTLYRARFGREISREDAREQGTKLVRLMQLIYKPMTEAEYAETIALCKETGLMTE